MMSLELESLRALLDCLCLSSLTYPTFPASAERTVLPPVALINMYSSPIITAMHGHIQQPPISSNVDASITGSRSVLRFISSCH